MQSFSTLNYFILSIYLACMLLVGAFFARRNDTAEQYFLAGRNMPWIVVAMSMFASLTSAVTFMGVPYLAFADNVSIFMGVLVSPLVAPILIKVFYGTYRRYKITTSYDYIAIRFGSAARYCVSALFVMARLGWLGTVIFAPAAALHVAAGLPLFWAIVLMGVLATAYTLLGGLRAVLWTDLAQFIVLAGGAIWLALSLTAEMGLENIINQASQARKFDIFNWAIDFKQMTATAAIVSYFLIFTQDYGTDQVSVQRLLSVKSFRGLSGAIIFNSFTDVIINGTLLFIGLGLFAKYHNQNLLPEGIGGVSILPYYIITSLPDGISGLLITGIFAAAMSSMDSGLNSVSTVIVNDFLEPGAKTAMSDKRKIAAGRLLTLVLGIGATCMAFYASKIGHIVEVWGSFMGLFSAPVLVIFLLGFYVKRAKFAHWLTGTLFSVAVLLALRIFVQVHWIYLFPISFITCASISVITAMALPGKPKPQKQ